MKIQINTTDCKEDMERFPAKEDLLRFLDGFDGVELMPFEDRLPAVLPKEKVVGIHARSLTYWYDLWRNDLAACLAEFGNEETLLRYLGGKDRSALVERCRRDLETAVRYGAEYIVMHVSHCSSAETVRGAYAHGDEEIVDAFCEMINEAAEGFSPAGSENAPLLLVENLWEPGFTFLRPEMTERLLHGIRYPKKGIMLDTGHLMNTNPDLQTPQEAAAYISSLLDAHGPLCGYIKGVHLNQSLSGNYIRSLSADPPVLSDCFDERYAQMFMHIFRQDQHRPFVCDAVLPLIERIAPDYLTFEFISSSLDELSDMVRQQKSVLAPYFR